MPAATASVLGAYRLHIGSLTVFGGEASITPGTRDLLNGILNPAR